jgi:UDP-GlcNAc:undecaprenyl-phosphate GlcNAc-1-phosphate transferase
MTFLLFMTGLLGLGTVLLAVPLILAFCRRAENLHRAPEMHHGQAAAVPRLGGLALVAAFIAVNLFAGIVSQSGQSSLLFHPAILLGCLAMFAIGFMDDVKPLGARKKLAGQVLIALAVCLFGVGIQTFKIPFTGHVIQLGPWGVFFTVLWLVAITNLINLVDGIDGLAAGIALMLMVLLGYVGHETGNFELLIAGMGGALLGFLRYNFPPARIYMGDGGAYFLGFQIGVLSLLGSHKGEVLGALAAPLFVLALPMLDTCLAILRRGLRGLPLFRPDRRHLHHHLLDTGMSHRKVVLLFYAGTLVFLVMGMAADGSRGRQVPILFGLMVLLLLLGAGRFKFSRRWFAIGRMVENSLNMRREIEYAVCLSRWLALEGRRGRGVENLWQTLALAADKLGFASVKLTLADGERVWLRPAAPAAISNFESPLRPPLAAPACPAPISNFKSPISNLQSPPQPPPSASACPHFSPSPPQRRRGPG